MNFSLRGSDLRCKTRLARLHLPVPPCSTALGMGLLSTHPADSYILCCAAESLSEMACSGLALDLCLVACCQPALGIKGKKSWLHTGILADF